MAYQLGHQVLVTNNSLNMHIQHTDLTLFRPVRKLHRLNVEALNPRVVDNCIYLYVILSASNNYVLKHGNRRCPNHISHIVTLQFHTMMNLTQEEIISC